MGAWSMVRHMPGWDDVLIPSIVSNIRDAPALVFVMG